MVLNHDCTQCNPLNIRTLELVINNLGNVLEKVVLFYYKQQNK